MPANKRRPISGDYLKVKDGLMSGDPQQARFWARRLGMIAGTPAAERILTSVGKRLSEHLQILDGTVVYVGSQTAESLTPVATQEVVSHNRPAEMAGAIGSVFGRQDVLANDATKLVIDGYGKPFQAQAIRAKWSAIDNPIARIGLALRAPSLERAPLAIVSHEGSFDSLEDIGLYAKVLAEEIPDSQDWRTVHSSPEPEAPEYSIFTRSFEEMGDVTVLLQHWYTHRAHEENIEPRASKNDTGATIREMRLYAETAYVLSSDGVSCLGLDGMRIGERPMALTGDSAEYALLLSQEADPDLLAPATTQFGVEQELLAA